MSVISRVALETRADVAVMSRADLDGSGPECTPIALRNIFGEYTYADKLMIPHKCDAVESFSTGFQKQIWMRMHNCFVTVSVNTR